VHVQSRVYEETLANAGIPYAVVGDKHFYESDRVQTLLGYLRTLENPSNPEVWTPILNRPWRGFSPQRISELAQGGWEAVEKSEDCGGFLTDLRRMSRHKRPSEALAWLTEHVRGLTGADDDDDGPIRWVDSLIAAAERHGSYGEFLRFVDWVIEKSKKPSNNAVQLMTIHRSKGLEFRAVFVAGMVEGMLPHQRSLQSQAALDEETRLCYVALTRAREHLYLLAAKRYNGKALKPSRFLEAIEQG